MTAPLLQAQDLTRHYSVSRGWFKPRATVRALDGVSFDLSAGRTLAVVGVWSGVECGLRQEQEQERDGWAGGGRGLGPPRFRHTSHTTGWGTKNNNMRTTCFQVRFARAMRICFSSHSC